MFVYNNRIVIVDSNCPYIETVDTDMNGEQTFGRHFVIQLTQLAENRLLIELFFMS